MLLCFQARVDNDNERDLLRDRVMCVCMYDVCNAMVATKSNMYTEPTAAATSQTNKRASDVIVEQTHITLTYTYSFIYQESDVHTSVAIHKTLLNGACMHASEESP